jgi:hypothetical protein
VHRFRIVDPQRKIDSSAPDRESREHGKNGNVDRQTDVTGDREVTGSLMSL